MKLPHQLAGLAFAFYMAVIIALVMTAVLTYLATGWTPDYWVRVLKGYAVAMPTGFLCVMVFRPVVVYLVRATVGAAQDMRIPHG